MKINFSTYKICFGNNNDSYTNRGNNTQIYPLDSYSNHGKPDFFNNEITNGQKKQQIQRVVDFLLREEPEETPEEPDLLDRTTF